MDFGLAQYHHLAELMLAIKGKAILSINNHPEMRKVFAWFSFKEVSLSYTVGGANNGKSVKELIFWNW